MRIISKWVDYYDQMQKHGGHDDRIVYVRHQKALDFKEAPSQLVHSLGYKGQSIGYYPEYRPDNKWAPESVGLGFCGKVYRGVRFNVELGTYPGFLPEKVKFERTVWNFDQFNTAVASLLTLHKEKKNDIQVDYKFAGVLKSLARNNFMEEWENWLKWPSDPYFMQWSIDNKIASAVLMSDCSSVLAEEIGGWTTRVVINPRLKGIDFARVMSVPQAWQEFEMFIGGILTSPGNPMIPITDKDRIKQHGFDDWSFRKIGKNSKVDK